MFSERIKELRLGNSMTQSELAIRLGVSPSAIGMYEQGRRRPDTEMLTHISQVFDVSVDYLLSNDARTSAASRDLTKYIDKFTEDMVNQPDLVFNGRSVRREQLNRIREAMKIGMLLVLSQSEAE